MTRPSLSLGQVEGVLPDGLYDEILLLGVRGFGINGFQPSNSNKLGIYDDAIFLITPGEVLGYNANTDPSRALKNVAVLQPGTYWYTEDLHGIRHFAELKKDDREKVADYLAKNRGKDYPDPVTNAEGEKAILPYYALRQDSPVTVKREGSAVSETIQARANWPWIDIHKGGYNTTSSAGCQTIYPDQWLDFRKKVYAAMDKARIKRISYTLVNQ